MLTGSEHNDHKCAVEQNLVFGNRKAAWVAEFGHRARRPVGAFLAGRPVG